ncbi:MAG: bacterioferritin-associated ferredoxin [Oceanicoccus sp.]|jgi:bacterioferritin-associated ferredoxin
MILIIHLIYTTIRLIDKLNGSITMYVCLCKGITERQVQQAIDNGADYKALREQLGVASDCGQCGNTCKEMLKTNQACTFYDAQVA